MMKKTDKITFRTTKEFKTALAELAKLHKVSIGQLIRHSMEILLQYPKQIQ